MANCDIIPLALTRACSGKCKDGGAGCSPQANVWVLAACEGVAALFQKQTNGHLLPLAREGGHIFLFADGLGAHLADALAHGKFAQLVLVGSASDIAWTQASLPMAVSKQVVAEIEYPLMAGWFSSTAEVSTLTQALDHVFQA